MYGYRLLETAGIPAETRVPMEALLRRYRELDTPAMVFLYEAVDGPVSLMPLGTPEGLRS